MSCESTKTFWFLSQAWNVWIAIEHKNIYGYFTVFNAKNFTPSYYFLLRLVIAQARASVWVCDTVYIALLLTFIGGPINPDLETKHNCEEWRNVHMRGGEERGGQWGYLRGQLSLSLSHRSLHVKFRAGARLSGRVTWQCRSFLWMMIKNRCPVLRHWPGLVMAPVCLVTRPGVPQCSL